MDDPVLQLTSSNTNGVPKELLGKLLKKKKNSLDMSSDISVTTKNAEEQKLEMVKTGPEKPKRSRKFSTENLDPNSNAAKILRRMESIQKKTLSQQENELQDEQPSEYQNIGCARTCNNFAWNTEGEKSISSVG